MKLPFNVDRRLFPVEHRFLDIDGTAIHYAGAEEKRDYTDALACRGIPKEVAEFALFNLHNAATSAGACRNALLLHTVGETLLSRLVRVDWENYSHWAYSSQYPHVR